MICRLIENFPRRLPVIFITLTLLLACTSRYRLDLFMTVDQEKKKVKVDESQFLKGTSLGDPYSEKKLASGSGSVLIITTGTRGMRYKQSLSGLFGFDEYLICRLYRDVRVQTIVAGTNEIMKRILAKMMKL